ncbi:MAG: hypothetical protein E6Q98_18650 [Rhodospirillaceae bacterium]|nr:MAG: hypothetical protein E6Q98_18650 [Rhodospirillaceae bacterium]
MDRNHAKAVIAETLRIQYGLNVPDEAPGLILLALEGAGYVLSRPAEQEAAQQPMFVPMDDMGTTSI